MSAADQGHRPGVGERAGEPEHSVGAAPRRLVEQDLPLRFVAGPTRQEVDHAAHGAGAVQGGSHPLDDLHLPEVHGRDLQQPEAARLAAVERQPVREEACVAAPHALDANAGSAERRRRGLHPHAAHLVEHHDDVPGRHEHLLLDLLPIEHLDPHRLVLDAAAGASAGDHGDLFLDRQFRLELDLNDSLFAGGQRYGHDGRRESFVLDCDLHGAGRGGYERDPVSVGHLRGFGDDDDRSGDRVAAGPHFDAEPACFLRCAVNLCWRKQENECDQIRHEDLRARRAATRGCLRCHALVIPTMRRLRRAAPASDRAEPRGDWRSFFATPLISTIGGERGRPMRPAGCSGGTFCAASAGSVRAWPTQLGGRGGPGRR